MITVIERNPETGRLRRIRRPSGARRRESEIDGVPVGRVVGLRIDGGPDASIRLTIWGAGASVAIDMGRRSAGDGRPSPGRVLRELRQLGADLPWGDVRRGALERRADPESGIVSWTWGEAGGEPAAVLDWRSDPVLGSDDESQDIPF